MRFIDRTTPLRPRLMRALGLVIYYIGVCLLVEQHRSRRRLEAMRKEAARDYTREWVDSLWNSRDTAIGAFGLNDNTLNELRKRAGLVHLGQPDGATPEQV